MKRAYYWLGVISDTEKNYKEAIESFQKCLALNPVQDVKIDAEYGLAMVFYKMGKEDEAMKLFLALLKTSKSDNYTEGLLRWLITLSYSKGAYTETLEECDILLAKTPAKVVEQFALLYAGKSALKLGDAIKGKEYLERIVKDSVATVYQADAYLELANLELKEKLYNKAFESYSMAAKLASGEDQRRIRAFGYAGMGESSEMLGNADEALRYYMSVGLLFNGDVLVPKCLSQAIKILEDKGEKEKADNLKKELKQNYPDSPEAKAL